MENYKKSGKIYVTNFGKIIQTILSIYDLISLLLTNPKDHLESKELEIISEEININERI